MANINIVDENGNIIPNLRADIMRKAMQPKGLLQHNGGIYAGTGSYTSIEAGGNTYKIYKTVEIYPQSGTETGTPIVYDPVVEGGLKFGTITSSAIADKTISNAKISPTGSVSGQILTSNGPNTAPSWQYVNTNMFADNSIPVIKLANDLCDTTVKSSGGVSIALGQDSTTNKIKISSLTFNYAAFAPYFAYGVAESVLKKFSVTNGILTIE